MIQPYLVFHNQIYKAIYLGLWKMLGTDFLGVELEEEQTKSECTEGVRSADTL